MSLAEIQKISAPIFKKHGIKHAAVFGSVSRGTDGANSDIDIFVTLGKPMGLIAYIRMNQEMESSLMRKVDLVTENSINKFIKPYILSDLKTIYEA